MVYFGIGIMETFGIPMQKNTKSYMCLNETKFVHADKIAPCLYYNNTSIFIFVWMCTNKYVGETACSTNKKCRWMCASRGAAGRMLYCSYADSFPLILENKTCTY